MARGPRICFPGAIFHVLNRFVDRHPFFRKDKDYEQFLDIFFEEAETFRISVYAYDLLPNHFHTVIETREGNISRFLQRFLSRAAQNLNRSVGRTGHLFAGRTKTLLVDSDGYFETVMGYVLLNRVRAGLARSIFSDEWNSVGELLTKGRSRLDRERMWPYLFGRSFDRSDLMRELAVCRAWLKSLDVKSNEKAFCENHRGSFLGSRAFRQDVLRRQERRREVKASLRRRKTDAPVPLESADIVEKICRRVADERRDLGRAWRSTETAVSHLVWFLLFTEGHWSLEQIRRRCLGPGRGHSKISMAISMIRKNPKKRAMGEAAREALREVLS